MTTADQPGCSRATPLTRRRVLKALLVGGAGGGLAVGGYTRFFAPFRPVVERVPLDLPDLGESLAGYRIIQLSDLHVGSQGCFEYLKREIRHVSGMRPDLVVITGDFLTYAYPGQIEMAVEVLRDLRATDGVLACLGNHDYHHNRTGPKRPWGAVAKELTAALAEVGVRVLRNERQVVRRGGSAFQVVGLDDWWRGFYDLRKGFGEVEPDLPCIVLQHNPDAVIDIQTRRCDWVLCGHTHGGQVRLPFIGPLYLPVFHTEYSAGLYRLKAGPRLYVNRGLGSVYPIRLNCPPEITEFTLVHASASRGKTAT